MTQRNMLVRGVSRRRLIRSAVGAGTALASGIAAPPILAQANKPIRLGNINTYTGGLAYAGQANWNAANLYFDSIDWTVAGRKIEIIKEDDQFNPQSWLAESEETGRERSRSIWCSASRPATSRLPCSTT